MPSKVKDVPQPQFEINDLHTKALLKLLFCHHTGVSLDYAQLSDEIGIGQKTKRWQCGAWKDLKSNDYIGGNAKDIKLTESGVALASSLASDEELAEYKMPESNEEHHEKIMQKLDRNEKSKRYGSKIFKYMAETYDKDAMTKHELADHFDTLADSHGFFYGFQALKNMGLIESVGVKKVARKRKKDGEDETAAVKDKGAEKEVGGSSDENGEGSEETKPPKKKQKVRKGKKLLEGGKTWKLSSKAFLASLGPVVSS